MRVDEIMSVPVYTCSASEPLTSAAHMMWEHDCGVVPIVNDKGKLVGMITDRDICMAAYTQGAPLDAIPIHTAMARVVVTASGDEPVDSVEAAMALHQVRRIPVVDHAGRPIGLVSLNDLARNAVATAAKQRIGIAKVVQTLAAISQPRTQAAQTTQLARRIPSAPPAADATIATVHAPS